MKNCIKGVVVFAMLCGMSAVGEEALEQGRKVKFEIGAGFLVSSGYNDFTTELYEDALGYDIDGGYGWMGFYLGARYAVSENFIILGGADVWFNAMDISGGIVAETYINTLITPSLYVQYNFTEIPSFYINGGVSIPVPYTGSSNLEFSGNGIGLGGNVGYAFGGIFSLEAGYTYLPVEVEETFTGFGISEDYNFGGFQLRGKWAF